MGPPADRQFRGKDEVWTYSAAREVSLMNAPRPKGRSQDWLECSRWPLARNAPPVRLPPLPSVARLNAIARCARSANNANALRRHVLDNSPSDGVARSPFISLRATGPPTVRRTPPSRGPQRPPPLTSRLSPSRAPRRLAARTGLRSSRLIPGPASPPPRRLHVRTPLPYGRSTAHQLLVYPAPPVRAQ